MKTRIIAVGCQLPSGPIEQYNFSFRPKLELDDILIINPCQTPVAYGYQFGTYHQKPCLNEALSEQVLADKEFWEDCILKRLMAGKNVYVFLEKPEQYYIHTGEVRKIKNGSRNESFSLVTLFHTYSILPAEVGRPTVANDLSPQSEIVDPLLKTLGGFLGDYIPRAYFPAEEFGGKAGIIHPISKTVIGGTVEVSNGRIILLPTLDLDRPEYLGHREGKEFWSEHAKKFIAKFADALVETERWLVPVEKKKETVMLTRFDVPEDATLSGIDRKSLFLTPESNKLETQISDLTQRIEQLKKEQETLCHQLETKNREEQEPNKLLFEDGEELDRVVLKVLNRLHIDPNPKESREADLTKSFVADEAQWLFSVLATDNASIDHPDLAQVLGAAYQSFVKDEAGEYPKMVVIANAFRKLDPAGRGEYFSAKCIRMAAQHRIALVRTVDLIPVFQYLRSNPKDVRFAALCREAILKSEGKVVRFPSPPQAKRQSLREAQRRPLVTAATFGHGRLW